MLAWVICPGHTGPGSQVGEVGPSQALPELQKGGSVSEPPLPPPAAAQASKALGAQPVSPCKQFISRGQGRPSLGHRPVTLYFAQRSRCPVNTCGRNEMAKGDAWFPFRP